MATNYKPVTGFGTIGKGSLQTKEQAQKKAVKRIDQKRKRKAYAYERSKEDVMYGTPGQGFKVIKGKEYPTLKDGKKATVDNMSISWIKENMKKKSLTKKANGGSASGAKLKTKVAPVKASVLFSEKEEKKHPVATKVINGLLFGIGMAGAVADKTTDTAKHLVKVGKKTGNFVKDTIKKVNKTKTAQKPVKKDVVATAKKQATKSYNAVKNYVPSTVKKVTKK